MQSDDLKELALHLYVDGWYVLDEVIPRDKVGAVRESVKETVVRNAMPGSSKGIANRPGLINFDQSFSPYLTDPRLMGIAERTFGPYFRISMTSGMVNDRGSQRTGLHADWPFNQHNAGHIPAPYPDAVIHLTTIWMLSDFTEENGGTIIVPGSHRSNNNPTGGMGINPIDPYPTELQVTGPAGSVMIFDSRMWHAAAPNRSDRTRVAMAIRFAPWWLNLDPMKPDSADRQRMVEEANMKENRVPTVPKSVYDSLPEDVKPLYRHWVGK